MANKIKIELMSDMCVSDGSIYNSLIDIDICHDSYGLPYIPAKRIKGCLRECALELKDWGYDININKLFGKEGDNRGAIIIYNAYLSDRDKIIDEIDKAEGNILSHPQNILRNYSYVRTQTAIDYDTGVADEKSLRTMRVVNKGLVFEAEVHFDELEEDEIKKFEDCLAILRHIGISRTRGYGEIKAELIDESENNGLKGGKCKDIAYEAGSIGLEYEIMLNTPIVCKSVAGQEEKSEDYIEGSKILGYLAQMINDKEDGKFSEWLSNSDIKCSNAYISVEGKRLYEAPAAMFEIKNDKINLRNKIYIQNAEGLLKDEMPSCDNGLQLNQMKHCYVYIDDDGNVMKKSVEMETRYHHKRPADKSIGRADSDADPDSVFYQISSIKEGQTFKGFITGKSEYIKEIYDYICANQCIMLGYGKNGEYGSCTIRVTGFISDKQIEEKDVRGFYVLLKSPAIIYSENAMYSTNAEDLKKEVFAAVIDKEYQDSNNANITKYINISVAGGYNVTWGCRKPTVGTFDKGTVLIVRIKNDNKQRIRTGQLWIGERNTEGFGEIEVKEFSETGNYCCKYMAKEKSDSEKAIFDISESKLMQKISNKLFKDFIRYSTSIYVNEHLNVDSSWKATVSNMMIMVKESSGVDEVENTCKERYASKNENKRKKAAKAEKILHIISGTNAELSIENLVEKFQVNYKISNYEYDIEYWKLYCVRELLIQIKYAVRQKEKREM